MCSVCEPDGFYGKRAIEEQREIHEQATLWALSGWFTYEVDWDAQNGRHFIQVKVEGEEQTDELRDFSPCEFAAFLSGMRLAAELERRRL